MTFSSLISGTIPHHGKYNDRPVPVRRVIQHHWAGTGGGIERLSNPTQKASATYLVLVDGRILGQVPEEFRPWTSGGMAADGPSITIECQNSGLGPDWPVSDESLNSIERLLADISRRYNFGLITPSNYMGHRQFASTACPGPYIWPRMQSIRDAANALLGGGTPVSNPIPTAPPADTRPRNADGSLRLAIDGSRGPATISRWQEVMGTPIDGVISKPKSSLIVADQRFLNSVVIGGHVRNLTGKGALDLDGDEGSKTIKVRQFWMRNAMNPQHQKNLIGHLLDVDGDAGPETTKVHQFALNNATRGSRKYGQV